MRIKLATVFSGIGSIEFALKRLKTPHDLIFACDNGEREIDFSVNEEFSKIKLLDSISKKVEHIDKLYFIKTRRPNYMEQSYLANYLELPKNRYFQDIRLLDGNDFIGEVDLFVGGSPCQSFSAVGFQKGLEDARGTLFYDFARLIKEIKPKVFIYENVRGIINHDKGNTWQIIKGIFDSLGYEITYKVLNAVDFGIPQNRRRLFVVGTLKKIGFDLEELKLQKATYTMQDFLINNCSEGNFTSGDDGEINIKNVQGIVDKKYELTPGVLNYVLQGGTKNFYQKPEMDLPVARTLLKTMGNHHRAGIDNYITVDAAASRYRQLTERETHRLMGFTDDYNIVVSRSQAYIQCGNSIVVDVFMAIVDALIKKNAFNEEV